MSSAYLPTYKERGSGPPLVWLHGIGGNQDSFDAQLSHFSRSWRCVVWDMPGYGNSPAPEELSFEMMADSVATLLEHLGESQAVVLGHSMGGMVAQTVALRHPNRVRALVLAASPAAFGKPGSDFAEKFLAQRLAPLDDGKTPADFALPVVRSLFANPGNQPAIDDAVASMTALSAGSYRAALGCLVTFNNLNRLKEITCPTLLMAGEEDTTTPPKAMESMARKIPKATYHCLSGLGHLANMEGPDQFNAALDQFLNTLPPR